MLLTETMMVKLESLQDRFEEVAALLSDAEIMADRERFTALSKEYAEIEPVVGCFQKATEPNRIFPIMSCFLTKMILRCVNWPSKTLLTVQSAVGYVNGRTAKRCCCPKIQTTTPMFSSRYAQAPEAMKPLFFPAISSVCTLNLLNKKAGVLRS